MKEKNMKERVAAVQTLKQHPRLSQALFPTFRTTIPSYRRAAALRACVSFSMRPFHLPAVTVDLGHYLESGVRHSGHSCARLCACGYVCVRREEDSFIFTFLRPLR